MSSKLQQLVDEANKEWGDGTLLIPELGGKMVNETPEVIPTGCKEIDDALGIGGIPCGRISEIMGQEACLDKDTFINFQSWDKKTGKTINHKGGSIENLYKKTQKKDAGIFITVPSFNEENAIFHNRVYDVVKTGKKQCFRITTLSGLQIIASPNHKFYTSTRGFVPLSKLRTADLIYIHNNTHYKKESKKRILYSETFVKYHPFAKKKTITANNRKGEKVYSYSRYRVRTSHFVYEAYINEMTPEVYGKVLNTAPALLINKMWFVPPEYEIHHRDENPKNDIFENLLLIKSGDHQKYHANKNHNKLRFVLTEDRIDTIIDAGERETYDIKCLAPYNNYIADKFAVHNSGKTTVVLHLIANAQAMGKRCAFIDAEHSLDRDRAEKIGVDFQKLAISQPDSGEQALELLEFLIRSGQFGLVVIDSVAALIPKAEIEGEMTDANIGSQARMMGKIMRKITAPTNKGKVCVIFTNQVRAKLGGFGFIPQTTTPGGNALKFYASMRLDMVRTGNKKRGETLLYTTHKMTVKKNKLAPPARIALFNIGLNGIINDKVSTDIV